jgi:cation diffusion facilitator family transporter
MLLLFFEALDLTPRLKIMVTLLRRLFIKDYQNVSDESVRVKHGKVAAIFGIISNLILVAMKLTAAFLIAASAFSASDGSKAYMSFLPMALVADAINNLSDMASSLVTLVGFKISAKPADKEHPFGHERIEYIAGLVVSTIVLVLAVELFRDSLDKIIAHETVDYDIAAIIVLGLSVLIKLGQSYVNFGMGKAISSEALKATALDSLTDAIATFAITISAILSLKSLGLGWNFLDGYMGVVVSLFVAYSGIKMIKETADPLIGEKGNVEFIDALVKDVKSKPGILGVHDVLCHSYGPTKYFVSLHAEVNQAMRMTDAHDLIDDVEREIKHKYHCDITIHMDPVAVGDKLTDELKDEVSKVLLGISPDLKFHDFRIISGPTHVNVIFDVLLPYDEKVSQELIMKTLEEHFKDQTPRRYFVVTFDRPY